MNKLLLVDIDTSMLNIFTGALKEHADKIEIMTAGSIKEIPSIISGVKLSMIIVDLKMPDMDDFEFLVYMSRNYPDIPVIVTTAFGTNEIEAKIKSLDSCEYLEKPIDMDVLKEKIFDEMNIGVGGQIHGIALSSFLQMSEMEKTTCKLKIFADDKTGFIYLLKGAVIAAETGVHSGEKAAFEIIAWDNTIIEIEKTFKHRKHEISMPLMNILMEALRIKDEKEEAAKAEKKDKEKKDKIDTAEKSVSLSEKSAKESFEEQPSINFPEGETLVMEAASGKEEISSMQIDEKQVKAKQIESSADEEVKITDISKKMKRKKAFVTLSLIAGAAFVIYAGWISWIKIIKPKMMTMAYDNALLKVGELKSLEEKQSVLQDYLEKNSGSTFTDDAEKKIEEIKNLIQERDFQKALAEAASLPADDNYSAKARTLYNEYLEMHPDGAHVDEIKEMIAKIDSSLDSGRYKAMQNIPEENYDKRLAAYNKYLSEHPRGKHRDEVTRFKNELAIDYYQHVKKEVANCEASEELDPCIVLLEKFIGGFKDSRRIKELKSLKEGMQIKKIMATLKERVEKNRLDYNESKEIYSAYLKNYPKSPAKKSIRAALKKIDQNIKEREEWEKTLAFSNDREIGVYVRIQNLKKYMAGKSSENYQQSAKKVMAMLEKEKQELLKRNQLAEEQRKKEKERLARMREEEKRINNEKLKMAAILRSTLNKEDYVITDSGTVTDLKTGLMWTTLDSHIELGRCLGNKEAKVYVENLSTGGFKDWHLPTTNDLLVMLNDEPGLPETGAKLYWTSESYIKGFYDFYYTVELKNGDLWKKSEAGIKGCGAVRAVRP